VRIIISVSFLVGVPQKEAALRRGRTGAPPSSTPTTIPVVSEAKDARSKRASFASSPITVSAGVGDFAMHARACLGAANVWRLP
jgi:hypothetical protein